MKDPKHDESKTNFQLERFSFFTDGVFAIAITLLVIEIKVPELKEVSDQMLWKELSKMLFKFLEFFISFGVIGHYWAVHHRIFGYAKKYTTTLLWINLTFLLSVILLPFSSGILGEYGTNADMKLPYTIYVGNMVFTGLMNIWMWLYVSNPARKLFTHEISKERINLGLYRSAIVPLVFIFSLLISYPFPILARFIPIIIPFILHWGMHGIEQKADLKEKSIMD